VNDGMGTAAAAHLPISVELRGVKLGVVEAGGVAVHLSDAAQTEEMDRLCAKTRERLTPEEVAGLDSIGAVRSMFRTWGIDPARYRPSSEALLRRVTQGKGLYRVSNVVDAANVGSIETGWPYGIYDRSRIAPPIIFRAGLTSETYEGIGKQTWHVAGRPVLADARGAFGSPISDSTRTMITESAREILAVIYAPRSATDDAIRGALEALGRRLGIFAGAGSLGLSFILNTSFLL